MPEYRQSAAQTLGALLASAGVAVVLGWWGITAANSSAPAFWQWWLVVPVALVVAGLVLVIGVLFDWFPNLSQARQPRDPQSVSKVDAKPFRHEIGCGCYCLGLTVTNHGRRRRFHAAIVNTPPGVVRWDGPPAQMKLAWRADNALSTWIGRNQSADLVVFLSVPHEDSRGLVWPMFCIVERGVAELTGRPIIAPSMTADLMIWDTDTSRSLTRTIGVGAALGLPPQIELRH